MKRAAIRIRPGTRRDIPTILRLIRGLAEYERLANQVEATALRLHRHGFGRHRYFQTLVCRRGQETIGFALYVFTYSTFLARPTLYVEDLFVVAEERGQGVGKALLAELARVAVRRGCGRMEWSVLDWDERANKFYESMGARPIAHSTVHRITGNALEKLADKF